MLRSSVARAIPPARTAVRRAGQTQTRQAHAISNPTLANIEKRWEAMPPQEQADLWMALRDRMKVDWNELTLQEKKAGMSFQSRLLCTTAGGMSVFGLRRRRDVEGVLVVDDRR